MKTIEIIVGMHKPFRVVDDPVYQPLQLGAAINQPFAEHRDDTGDNISQKNRSFCELTGVYWMWRNSTADYQGLVHYRRYFADKHLGKAWERVASGNKISKLLESIDVILPSKRHYYLETNYSQYAHAHHEKDLYETRKLLEEYCPDYLQAFDQTMKRRSGHRFNMFIMKREVFHAYASWLFPLLFELEKRIDITGYDAYNQRVIGFIAERLLDVWIEKEGISFRQLPVVNIEPVNWPKKIFLFLKRKLLGILRPRN